MQRPVAKRDTSPDGRNRLGLLAVLLWGAIAFTFPVTALADLGAPADMSEKTMPAVMILLDTSARRPRMPLLTRLRALAFLRLLGSLIRVRTPGQMRQIVDRVRTDQRRKLRRLARRGRRRFSSRARRKYGQWLRHAQLLIRAHGRAVARYRLRRYPGRIVQFFARDTSVARLRDSRLDWGQVAGGGFDVYVVPGDHHHMLEEPDVQPLARQLRACLDEVQRAPSAAARE